MLKNSKTDYDFKFSIVMAIYNTENYLNEAIDSVINQTLDFKENIQLILVNDGSEDNSEKICLKYREQYPKNIFYISQKNAGQASARNNGLNYIKGKYVNFLDSDDYFDLNAFDEVYKFFENHYTETDVVSIPIYFFERETNQHVTNEKFNGSRVIDLNLEPNNIQMHTNSAFIKSECFKFFKFPTNVSFSEDVILINEILLEKKTLGILSTAKYHYRKRYDESSLIDGMSSKKEYYNERLTNYFLYLIDYAKDKEGEVPKFLQYVLAYDLQWIFEQADLSVLTSYEQNDFFNTLRIILDNISTEAILKNRFIKNPFRRDYFLYKKENDLHIEINEKNHVLLKTNDYILDNIYFHKIWFDIVEFDKATLKLSGLFNSLFDIKNVSIEAIREKENGKIDYYPSRYVKYTSRKDIKFFNETFQFKNNFDLKIPIEEKEISKIKIRVNYHKDGNNKNFTKENIVSNFIGLDFTPHAKFSKLSNYTFKGSHILYFEDNEFHLIPYSFLSIMKKELVSLKKIYKSKHYNYRKAIFIRVIYFLSYPLFFLIKKGHEIYLFQDRIDAGDDNGEHLFRYAINQKDNIKKYFVLSENSPEFDKISGIGKIIKYGSFKHKLMIFHADKIISSHPYESVLNPFFDIKNDQRDLFAGLMKFKIYFVQHGVNLGNISSWLSKYDKNLYLISSVSQLEKDAYLEEGYNYEESIVQVLGLPRYDNLKNSKNKQVLIMPSWRRYLKRDKQLFLNSNYYNNLNSLLNNRELINILKKADYEIVFKPHPELNRKCDNNCRFVDLFDIPKDIRVSTEESYQELLNNSSLMITDYSSVFFDFAYLKKPVIYYQKEDDFRYYGYFDMKTMGYGDIIDNEKELIKKVDFYINNDCTMESEYVERVDSFFKYKDQNNCKRVYDWIKEH